MRRGLVVVVVGLACGCGGGKLDGEPCAGGAECKSGVCGGGLCVNTRCDDGCADGYECQRYSCSALGDCVALCLVPCTTAADCPSSDFVCSLAGVDATAKHCTYSPAATRVTIVHPERIVVHEPAPFSATVEPPQGFSADTRVSVTWTARPGEVVSQDGGSASIALSASSAEVEAEVLVVDRASGVGELVTFVDGDFSSIGRALVSLALACAESGGACAITTDCCAGSCDRPGSALGVCR